MSSPRADISENDLKASYPEVLELLLSDRSTGNNLLWGTDDYIERGVEYYSDQQITVPLVTGKHGDVIQPRTYKDAEDQSGRTKERAEVFTPRWVINAQINFIDDEWFGHPGSFNETSDDLRSITVNTDKIAFPDQAETPEEAADDELLTWQSYVRRVWMEITCGEAPYVVNRYDAAEGQAVDIIDRCGVLDRKLRVIDENIPLVRGCEDAEWFEWVKRAYQSVYGYEWQGDSLLIARENLLFTFFDICRARYDREPAPDELLELAEIISWNFFQMDGLKYVVPDTCHDEEENWRFGGESLFDEEPQITIACRGCVKGDPRLHTGIYAKTMDWSRNRPVRLVDLLEPDGRKRR